MAAAVVSVVVEDFLRMLSSERIKLGPQWGVERELGEILDLLSSVQGVLPAAEYNYVHRFELHAWVRELKLAVFDAEDQLEELSMEEEALMRREGKVRRLFQSIDKLMFGWRMRRELRHVVGRLRDLVESAEVSFLRDIPSGIIAEDVHKVLAIPLVWRDYEKRLLTGLLMDRGLMVVVEGESGIGMATLVRKVITEFEGTRHFDIQICVKMWSEIRYY